MNETRRGARGTTDSTPGAQPEPRPRSEPRPRPEATPQPEASPHAPSLHLDDQLCFALYDASRAVTSAYRPLLDALGLTYPQYLVLLVLWERGPAHPVPVKELGAALRLDYGTVSPLLKRMEKAGLVRRDRDPRDERSVLIAVTEQGQALRQDAGAVPVAGMEFAGLGGPELVRLRGELRELADRVREAASATPR